MKLNHWRRIRLQGQCKLQRWVWILNHSKGILISHWKLFVSSNITGNCSLPLPTRIRLYPPLNSRSNNTSLLTNTPISIKNLSSHRTKEWLLPNTMKKSFIIYKNRMKNWDSKSILSAIPVKDQWLLRRTEEVLLTKSWESALSRTQLWSNSWKRR
jgi:hypothetical protein